MPEHDPARKPAEAPLLLRTARDLPHSLESEQAVLGAVLVEETAFDQVAAMLKASTKAVRIRRMMSAMAASLTSVVTRLRANDLNLRYQV